MSSTKTVGLNYEQIGKHAKRITKIKYKFL